MNWINQIFSDNFVSALGWTILHSIWQGALIAVIFAIIMISFRTSSSGFRYTLSVIALVTTFVFSLTTFLTIYELPSNQTTTLSQSPEFQILVQQLNTAEKGTTLSYFGSYFDKHLPLLVSVWFLGITVLMLKFLGGLAYTQRLKYHHTQPVENYWQGTLNYLMTELQMQKPVKLLESAMVKAPMVIGTLKPVILVPIGLLSNLPAKQVEMILIHELAHIKRYDYLVNILQSIVEIALFFNPFVWWISANIRQERENCCDDIALSITDDKMTFVKTLANIEAMRLETPELALGFAGQKGSLMNRVSRLLNQNYRKSSFSEGFWSAVVLVFCLVLASMTFNPKQEKEKANVQKESIKKEMPTQKKESKVIIDRQPETEKLIQQNRIELAKETDDTIRFGKDYMVVTYPNGKVEIFKSGQKIDKEEYEQYKDVFEVKNEELTLKSTNPISLKVDTEVDSPEEENLSYAVSIDLTKENNAGSILFRNSEGKKDVIELLSSEKTSKDFIIKLNDKVIFDASQFGENLENSLKQSLSGLENIKLDLENFGYNNYIFKKLDKLVTTENVKVKELQKAKVKALKKQREKKTKAYKKLRSELENDGLIKNKNNFRMSGKHRSIKVNGKPLKGKYYDKYEKLLKELLNIDVSRKGTKWSWSYVQTN